MGRGEEWSMANMERVDGYLYIVFVLYEVVLFNAHSCFITGHVMCVFVV